MKDLRIFAATAVLVGLSLFSATGVLAQPCDQDYCTPTPTPPTQEEIFNAKLARLTANAESMPIPVGDVITSLTNPVAISFDCPPGTAATDVVIKFTTTRKDWDPKLATDPKTQKTAIGLYGLDVTTKIGPLPGQTWQTLQITFANWVMLDPDYTIKDEAKPPMGPLADEGVGYHELLHGQLLINLMNTDAWRAEACHAIVKLTSAEADHEIIYGAQDGYLDKRAGGMVDVKVVEVDPKQAAENGEFWDIDLGSTAKLSVSGDPEILAPRGGSNVANVHVRVETSGPLNGHITLSGELVNKGEKGKFLVRIDPLSEWIIGGLENAIVVLPPSVAVGGIAELPEIAGSEAATSETASTNYALWAAIAAGATIGAIGLGAGLWYTRRRLG
jgi:hypothetical protein